MLTYNIDTLISFFRSQQKCGYETIELIIEILEISDEKLDADDRWDTIMFALRCAGLNDVFHNGGKFLPREEKYYIDIEPGIHQYDNRRYSGDFLTEPQTLNFLDGQLIIEFPLN